MVMTSPGLTKTQAILQRATALGQGITTSDACLTTVQFQRRALENDRLKDGSVKTLYGALRATLPDGERAQLDTAYTLATGRNPSNGHRLRPNPFRTIADALPRFDPRLIRALALAADIRTAAQCLVPHEFHRAVMDTPNASKNVSSVKYTCWRAALPDASQRAWLDAAFGRATGYVPARRGQPRPIPGYFRCTRMETALRIAAAALASGSRMRRTLFQRQVLGRDYATIKSLGVCYSAWRSGLTPAERTQLDAAYVQATGYSAGIHYR